MPLTALRPELPALMAEEHVRAALLEDLGRAGDITTYATIAPDRTATAEMNARENGVVAGMELARTAFRLIDPAIRFDALVADGDRVHPGAVLARISGPARGLLSAERVALNFLMHLCGIATYTSKFASEIAHTRAKVCCTRKTIPGLRALEKYAVRLGGGSNHRYGLDDAILIKDNHIAVAGGIRPALEGAKAVAGHLMKIEIEVDTLAQLREVLDCGLADVVLLDNMSIADTTKAVDMVAGRLVIEASGSITLDKVAEIAATGVDYMSSGAITHSAPNLDIALDIEM